MKRFFLSILIIFLIFLTSIIKNSTKNIDAKIINLKEEIRLLNEKYELVLLDHNFLSSPKKLNEYQKKYFENDLIPKKIKNILELNITNNEMITKELINKSGDKFEKNQ
tara:strand:- start:685 stop:1011 length:327 start_codon:yes stop_codon:yes gene_type:complete